MKISKKRVYISNIIFSVALVISCNYGEQTSKIDSNGIYNIEIQDLDKASHENLSKFVQNVNTIPLEFTKESIIGKIKKINFLKGNILIQDEQNNSNLLMFTAKGKFIKKIGQVGKGPAEHLYLTDFAVDSVTNTIFIYDNGQKKVLKFDNNGNYINELFIKISGDNFTINDGQFYFYRFNPTVHFKNNLIIEDLEGKVIEQYMPANPSHESGYQQNMFTRKGKSVIFNTPFSDTVYSHTKGKLRAAYAINFGKNKISSSDLNFILSNTSQTQKILTEKNYATSIGNFMISKDLIFFTFVYKSMVHSCFYNSKSKDLYYGNAVINDINYLYFCEPIFQIQDTMIGVYYPTSISNNVQHMEDKKLENDSQQRVKIQASIDLLKSWESRGVENLNPILIVYKVK